MRRRRMLAVAGSLATAFTARQALASSDRALGRLQETPDGKAIPEGLVFLDADGAETRFDAFRGRGLVVNFWATWCPPCVAEMPALDRAHAALAADRIEILALSSDRGGKAQVAPFYARTGVRNLGIWLDPRGATGRALGVRGLPTTLILDRNGREVARLEGEAEWDRLEMLAAIRRLVGPASPITTQS